MSLVGQQYREGWLYAGGVLGLSVVLFAWLFDQATIMNGVVLGLLLLIAVVMPPMLEDALPIDSTTWWIMGHGLGLAVLGWLTLRILSGETFVVGVLFAIYASILYVLSVVISMAYRGSA